MRTVGCVAELRYCIHVAQFGGRGGRSRRRQKPGYQCCENDFGANRRGAQAGRRMEAEICWALDKITMRPTGAPIRRPSSSEVCPRMPPNVRSTQQNPYGVGRKEHGDFPHPVQAVTWIGRHLDSMQVADATSMERLLPRRRLSQTRPLMRLIPSAGTAYRRICCCRIRNAISSPTRARAIVGMR